MRFLRFSPPACAVPALLGLLAGAVMPAAPASAQVTTNRGALDALGTSHHAGPAPKAAAHAAPRHHAAARPAPAAPASRKARPVSPHPPAATIPPAPPPMPVFRAPVINVPLHPPPPPPPVAVVPTATGAATPLDGGLRLTFGGGSADLNPATMQALHGFADRLKADPLARADLDATSAGGPDDPSTPRRVALSRGLAARAVLINDGIASTRIYVRVLGGDQKDAGAPADRVDLMLSRPPGDAPAAPATPAAGAPTP